MAVIMGLQWVEKAKPVKVVLCVDSVSVLLSLQSLKSGREDLLMEVHQSLYRLFRIGIKVCFCWVPAHVGIKGNEEADKTAKIALKMTEVLMVPFGKGEAKSLLKKEMNKKWQNRWDSDNKGRTYYNIQRDVSAQGVTRENRREETVLTRLRFDHTGLNKTLFVIGKSNTDKCAECNLVENAEHVLMQCKRYEVERMQLRNKVVEAGVQWDILGILGTSEGRVQRKYKAVVEFLKRVGVYCRI